MSRRPALVKVQIARRELGLDDAVYRAVLERETGKSSSAECSDAELGRVLDALKARGWKPKLVDGGKPRTGMAPVPGRRADHPAAKKARALWLSLWHLGEVRDPSEAALEAFARRQLGVERLQWADQARVYKLIEALKAMAERAGWSQDVAGYPKDTDLVKVLKLNLVRAQMRRLGLRGMVDERDLDGLIAGYGIAIRAAEADA